MDSRYITAAHIMARHGRERVKVVDDDISPLYFTQDEHTHWLNTFKDKMPQDIPTYRRGENIMKIINRTLAGPVLAQTAFAQRSLKTAVLLGAKQYILLDAGYGTFPYRQPDWAQKLQIFETNPLDIAMDKQARLTRAAIPVPDNVNYVYADIKRQGWPDLLLNNPCFDREKVSFVDMGTLAQHTDKAYFARLLQRLADILPAGSSVVLGYSTADYACDTGEDIPWGEMEKLIAGSGFLIYEQLEKEDVEQQLFYRYNLANIRNPLKAPQDVNYILAVKKG